MYGLVPFVKGLLFCKIAEPTYSIEELLAENSKEAIHLNEEDCQWLNDKPAGKEVL